MKIYNQNLKKFIELNKGENFCDKCGGRGRIVHKQANFQHKPLKLQCDKCLGEGKLDWIENAVGKGKKSRR